MEKMSVLTKTALILAIIGAINWGLIGFLNWNLVNAIFGGPSQGTYGAISRIIYAIVGVAGIALAVLYSRLREAGKAHVSRRAEVRP